MDSLVKIVLLHWGRTRPAVCTARKLLFVFRGNFCFYENHSEIIGDYMAVLWENLTEREKDLNQNKIKQTKTTDSHSHSQSLPG